MQAYVKQHRLGVFFVLAYIISWLLWAPSILSSRGLLPFRLPDITSVIGNFGPALAAIAVAGAVDGKAGVSSILKKLTKWRVRLRLYALAFIPVVINIMLIALYSILSGNYPQLSISGILTFMGLYIFWLVLGGPLGEEIGWRGYALPILQTRNSALSSAFKLSLIWFGWHLIRYLDPRMAEGGLIAIILFGLQVVIFSILFTWIYNLSNGSLLIVILFHAAINSLQYMITIAYPNLTSEEFGRYFVIINIIMLMIYLIASITAAILMARKRNVSSPQSIAN